MTAAGDMAETLIASLARVSTQAAVLVVLVVAVQFVLRDRISPRWRYILWSLPFVRLAIPWSIPAPFSLYAALTTAYSRVEPLLSSWSILQPPSSAALERVGRTALGAGALAGVAPCAWVAGIWLTGAAALLGFSLLQAVLIWRRTRRYETITDPDVIALLEDCKRLLRVHVKVGLLAASDSVGPALLGFFFPRVLLPRRTLHPDSREHLRYVLLHELAHLKRRDILAGWTIHLILSVHWFNPVVWWAKRRCTADRELACDADVLSALGRDERRAYGHALLDQVQCARPAAWNPGLAGVLAGTTTLERRIAMIASFKAPTWRSAVAGLTLLVALGAASLTDAPKGRAEKPAPDDLQQGKAEERASATANLDPMVLSAVESRQTLETGAHAAETQLKETPPSEPIHDSPTPTALLDSGWRKMAASPGAALPADGNAAATEAKDARPAKGQARTPTQNAKAPAPVAASAAKPGAGSQTRNEAAYGAKVAAAKNEDAVAVVALETIATPFTDYKSINDWRPSRIRHKIESGLALYQSGLAKEEEALSTDDVSSARETAAKPGDRENQDTAPDAAAARPKKFRNKIGATWRSLRRVLGGGEKRPVGRGDRFDPAYVGSIVGPAANGGNSSLIPSAEPVRGVEVTMSFSRPSLKSIPKVEWGLAEGVGTRSAS